LLITNIIMKPLVILESILVALWTFSRLMCLTLFYSLFNPTGYVILEISGRDFFKGDRL
jgi:hypothetical protein